MVKESRTMCTRATIQIDVNQAEKLIEIDKLDNGQTYMTRNIYLPHLIRFSDG